MSSMNESANSNNEHSVNENDISSQDSKIYTVINFKDVGARNFDNPLWEQVYC